MSMFKFGFDNDHDIATDNLGRVQMMILGKLGQTMAQVDTLNAWIPYIQKMEKRIQELEAKVAELEKPTEHGGSGAGHYGGGPWG